MSWLAGVAVLAVVLIAAAIAWRASRPTPPLLAVRRDDPAALERAIDRLGPEILDTWLPEMGGTLLHAAAAEGAVRCVRVLLARGAVVDARWSDGTTPLVNAAHFGHLAAADALLAAGADPDLPDDLGTSPLHFAAAAGHADVVDRLLAAGADPEVKEATGQAPRDVARGAAADRLAGARYAADFRMAETLARWSPEKRARYELPRAWGVAKDDPLLLAAHARARETRPALVAALEAGGHVRVKIRLPVGEHSEAVWCDVVGRGVDGDLIAQVVTQPTTGSAGGPRAVPLDDVLDWETEAEDGALIGGWTNRVTFEAIRREFGFLPADLEEELARFRDS